MTLLTEQLGPAWVDLGTSDPDRAASFYSALLGWAVDPVDDPAAGGYRLCRSVHGLVAGLGPLTPGLQDRSWWDVHLGTPDVDATAERVDAAGGDVLAGPIDVLGLGRLTVCADPSGAQFRLLEGLAAEVFDAPGSLCWVERVTDDVEGFADFGKKAFGWRTQRGETGYVTLTTPNGSPAVGLRRPTAPCESTVHWIPYFAVDDVVSAVARAAAAGATVLREVHPVPAGKAALIADPTGAVVGMATLDSAPAPR